MTRIDGVTVNHGYDARVELDADKVPKSCRTPTREQERKDGGVRGRSAHARHGVMVTALLVPKVRAAWTALSILEYNVSGN